MTDPKKTDEETAKDEAATATAEGELGDEELDGVAGGIGVAYTGPSRTGTGSNGPNDTGAGSMC